MLLPLLLLSFSWIDSIGAPFNSAATAFDADTTVSLVACCCCDITSSLNLLLLLLLMLPWFNDTICWYGCCCCCWCCCWCGSFIFDSILKFLLKILSDILVVSLLRDNGSDCVCDTDRTPFDCELDASIGAEDLVGVENMYISLVVLSKLVEPNVILVVKADDRPVDRDKKKTQISLAKYSKF